MKEKRKAARVCRPNTARAIIKNHTIILNGRRHVVKIDTERVGEIAGDIFGGLALAAMLFAIPVITLLLTGGY